MLGTDHFERACRFYDATLAPLGIQRVAVDAPDSALWKRPGDSGGLWVGKPFDGQASGRANGSMVAFTAPSRAAVDAAHAAALAAGGQDDGAPGIRAHYASDYYGAYVRDPDGHKLHFVRRGDDGG